MKKIKLFEVFIAVGSYEEFIHEFFAQKSVSFACVNQYYMNLAYVDSEYTNLLNNFDIVHPDGIGVKLALDIKSDEKIHNPKITGSDLYFKLLTEMNRKGMKLFIFGDTKSVLDQALDKILKDFPGIVIVGSIDGYIDIQDIEIVKKISKSEPDVLFIGLGAKKQERWINQWNGNLPNTRIIAIGGGLKVISNYRPRGPKFIQKIGLEWFVRLIHNPKQYWKRYLIGIPLFIFRVLKEKYKK